MSKHTPGPWRVGKWSSHSGRIDMLPVHSHEGERTVCAVWNFGEKEQTEADASLITAAPEMYAALKKIQDSSHRDGCPCNMCRVIARAEGRS